MKVDFKDLDNRSKTPVFAYCRELLKEGVDGKTVLEVYRGETLCLTLLVWAGAELTIKERCSRTGVGGGMFYRKWEPMPVLDNK